jgi:hypothetical protein
LRQAPPVPERLDDLSVALAPEGILQRRVRLSPSASTRSQSSSTASVVIVRAP